MASKNADALLAGGVFELASDRVANIVLDAGAEVVLHTGIAIPEQLIHTFTDLVQSGSRYSFTNVALGGFAKVYGYLTLDLS